VHFIRFDIHNVHVPTVAAHARTRASMSDYEGGLNDTACRRDCVRVLELVPYAACRLKSKGRTDTAAAAQKSTPADLLRFHHHLETRTGAGAATPALGGAGVVSRATAGACADKLGLAASSHSGSTASR